MSMRFSHENILGLAFESVRNSKHGVQMYIRITEKLTLGSGRGLRAATVRAFFKIVAL